MGESSVLLQKPVAAQTLKRQRISPSRLSNPGDSMVRSISSYIKQDEGTWADLVLQQQGVVQAFEIQVFVLSDWNPLAVKSYPSSPSALQNIPAPFLTSGLVWLYSFVFIFFHCSCLPVWFAAASLVCSFVLMRCFPGCFHQPMCAAVVHFLQVNVTAHQLQLYPSQLQALAFHLCCPCPCKNATCKPMQSGSGFLRLMLI